MIKRKLKIAFAAFFGIVGITVLSGVQYLESERFANSVKRMISKHSNQNLGIIGDFSHLELHLFPPGIGVANPTIRIEKDNISKLPIEGEIEANEMRVSFAPIQMLSGTIQIKEVLVRQGSVIGKVGPEIFKATRKPKTAKSQLRWQDLFRLQINGVRFEDTYLNVHSEIPRNANFEPVDAECVVKHLSLEKIQRNDKTIIASEALVNALRLSVPKDILNFPIQEANEVNWKMELSDEGLKLAPFFADLAGVTANVEGTITGNILDSKSALKLSGNASLNANLGDFFWKHSEDSNWNGTAEVNAKFEALLNDFEHTFKGEYRLSGKDFVWKNVHATAIKGEGKLDLAGQKIEIKSLEAEDATDPKKKGSFKVEHAAIPFQMNEAFQTRIQITDSDMHWLGGAILKEIYNLDGKISGAVDLQLIPGDKKNWKLKAHTDLSVDQFALTNQSLGETKPMHYILRPILPLKLMGGLEISPNGLDFRDFAVKMQKSHFDVVGGVHAKTGYEFKASGVADLQEMHQIAQNNVTGIGELSAHIHGPTSHVVLDFDASLNDTSYLDLQFGNVKGRVTYDDGDHELRFTGLNAKQRNTFYSVEDGFISLENEDVDLPFEIHSGRVEDLSILLDPLVKKISWFPHSLKGDLRGKVQIGGKISTPLMEITSQLEGSDWQWYGEKARNLKLNFGYDKGTYYVHNAVIVKTNGELRGDIDYNSKTEEMNWSLNTANLTLLDVDFIDRLEIPAKAKIEVKSFGSGKMGHLKSRTDGRIYSTELKGESLEPTTVSLEAGENSLKGTLDVFGSSLHSQFKYATVEKQPSTFKMTFNHFDFSPILYIVNPKLLDDTSVKGNIDGDIQLDFLTGQAELARGQISIARYSLEKTGFALSLAEPINLPVQLGYFNLNPVHFHFKNSDLVLQGEGRKGVMDLNLTGGVDLAIAELFSSAVQKASGRATTDLRITGPLKEMTVNGDVNVNGANMTMRWMQTPLEEMDGTIHIRKGLLYIDSIESYLGDDVFTLSGRIETFTDRLPVLDLHAQFDDNKVKLLPLEMVQVRGTASITGSELPYKISGNMEVVQALWTRSFGGSGSTAERGDRFAPHDRDVQGNNSAFALDLNVSAPQGFQLKNEIIDAEFKGHVKLVGPPDNPKLLGEGQAIQGKVLFRDRPFIFESVKVDFDDPYQLNPKFNAIAVSEVNQYKIRVLAYGRADSWKAEFSSTPFLPESEIFSLLASGLTQSETSRYRTRDRTFVDQGQAASLILHSLDFSRDVQNKTGFQFDVEEAVDVQSANSVFRPQSIGENVAAPKVVLKRKVGQKVNLSLGSTVGVGTQIQREVNAEYSLTHSLSLLGVWTNIEETDLRDTRTSFGMDLKFNKKFK